MLLALAALPLGGVIASLATAWRVEAPFVGWTLLCLGAFVALVNCFLSWGRYPLLRALGNDPDDIKWVSGLPLVGTITVVALFLLPAGLWLSLLVLVLLLLDTGSLLWVAISAWNDPAFAGHG